MDHEQQARETNAYPLSAAQRIAVADKDATIARLTAELERERMRLVACGVVAMADTASSAETARKMHPDYESAACADVARRVDECIRLRADLGAARAEVEAPREDAARYRWLRAQHWDEAPLAVVAHPKRAIKLGYDCPSLERLDAAIDSARKAPATPTGSGS